MVCFVGLIGLMCFCVCWLFAGVGCCGVLVVVDFGCSGCYLSLRC